MADYPKIMELCPEVADFLNFQSTIGHRGDVLSYAANIQCPSFSTDSHGFRHSVLDGSSLSFLDCIHSERYGVVLGASNSFGFGVAGNENTMASLLAERFGFPFANCAMPGANSRNLTSLLMALFAGGGPHPSVVVLSNGGDLGNFCDAGTADAVFGSPNRTQLIADFRDGRVAPDPEPYWPHLVKFTALWAAMIARLCRGQKTQLVMVHQSTFFEKATPSAREREFRLGEPFNVHHERMFANHRRFNEKFYATRKALADRLEIPLAGWEAGEELGFIDEFHLDRESARRLSDKVGDAIEKLDAQ